MRRRLRARSESIAGVGVGLAAERLDKEFADGVRAYYAAGVRQMLVHAPEQPGRASKTIAGWSERVIPELRAELTRRRS